MGDHLDLAGWHIVDGAEQFAALLGHDNDAGRRVDDPAHHVALGRRGFASTV